MLPRKSELQLLKNCGSSFSRSTRIDRFRPVSEHVQEVFNAPTLSHSRKEISGRPVLPHAVTNCFERLGLETGLSKQSAEISREHITTSPLGQERIARRVHENFRSEERRV